MAERRSNHFLPIDLQGDDDNDGYTNLEEYLHAMATVLEDVPIDQVFYPLEIQQFKFFPNPVKRNLSIFPFTQIRKVEILDISGKVVRIIEHPSSGEIDLGALADGLYVMKIYTSSEQPALHKLIKQ